MSLIDEVKAVSGAERAAALRTYRDCLLGDKRGNVSKLREAMLALGYDPDRLEADLAVIKEAASLEMASKAPEGLQDAIEAAHEAWNAYAAETRRITAEREREASRLWSEFRSVQLQITGIADASRQLNMLKMRNRDLFPEAPVIPADPEPGTTGAFDIGEMQLAIEEHNKQTPSVPAYGAPQGVGL